MSQKKQFENRLKDLLRIRLDDIYRKLKISGAGQPRKEIKRKIKEKIKYIVDCIPDVLVKTKKIRDNWKNSYDHKKTILVSGRGFDDKTTK